MTTSKCPFCGCNALAMQEGAIWAVFCNNDGTWGDDGPEPCNARGPERTTEAEAIAAWDYRPTPDAAEREGLAEATDRDAAAERAHLAELIIEHIGGIGDEPFVVIKDCDGCWLTRTLAAHDALRTPATPTPDARTDTGKLLAENEGLIAHAKAAAYGIKRVAELEAALRPFADYADPRNTVPAGLHITQGSYLVKRQLTMGDCYGARAALADTAKGEGHE